MAVSGTSTWNPTAVDLLTSVFRKLGTINDSETPDASMLKAGMFALNGLTKQWEALGFHVWTEEEGIIFLQQYQRRYLLGGTTTDHACDANAWNFTTLSQSAAQNASSVTVTSTAGMTVGDKFGVVLDAGNAFWTTITSLPGGNVVNMGANLTGAANAGACVFDYPPSAQLVRPLRVPFIRRLQYQPQPQPGSVGAPDWGGIITPLAPVMSRQEFFDLPQPTNPGLVTEAYYNPARDQGEMWVWNVSQNANWGMRFTYYRPLQDWVNNANTADFPQEWSLPLQWNLCEELMLDYSISEKRAPFIMAKAKDARELVEGWDRESQSVFFGRSSPQSRG